MLRPMTREFYFIAKKKKKSPEMRSRIVTFSLLLQLAWILADASLH